MKDSLCAAISSPLRPSASPPARHPTLAGFRLPSFGPPCIHEAHFRHRGASVFGSLRSSATVAAWHPGPAALVRGKASIPPGVVSTGSGASVRRDLPGFASACVHPCPENCDNPKFSAHYSASTGPASFRRRSGSRLAVLITPKLQQEAATAPDKSVTVAARSAPRLFSPYSPPSHQR